MISRACKAFPGVVMSLMLASPSIAATTAEPPRDPHARHAPTRPVIARKRIARPAVHAPAAHQHLASAPQGDSWSQSGMASWYGGKRWQGKMTASGAHYNEVALTAAHATLPIGSHVRVVDDRTGRSVLVTINDRPGTRKRIIDLSRGAAEALGILNRGVARVTLLPG